jgi:uncharacterized protein
MAKILFFVLIIAAVYLAIRARRSSSASHSAMNSSAADAQDIVACSRCGLHVPLAESVEANGRHYCCAEHSHLG